MLSYRGSAIFMSVAALVISSCRCVSLTAKSVSAGPVNSVINGMSSGASLKEPSNPHNSSDTFKYFAFGSNLLEKRMHVNNPSARRFDIGLLEGYRLDFGTYKSNRWGGYVATIVPDSGKRVWGAIWDVGLVDMSSLDNQEGVHLNIYKPINVTIATTNGQLVECRCYLLVNQPAPPKVPGVPNELPSKIYLDTIIKGAKESKLPTEYVQHLELIPHNGFEGPVHFDSH